MTLFNRFTGKIAEGYKKATKSEIQTALLENNFGNCRAFVNENYGAMIIVSTVIAGNLVLQHGFYPIAYIRPETKTAVLNQKEVQDSQFKRVQNLIKETCEKIIPCEDVAELINYVNENQNFGLSN